MAAGRIRDWGIQIGRLGPGPRNCITDVPGILVGHATLIEGEGPLHPGDGPVRTGVTVILPHGRNLFREKVTAAVHTINGFGKPVGFEQVRELGYIEAPIALTNTLNVGLVLDALVEYSIQNSPEIGITASSVNVVVGETNDGALNDLQGRHVRARHVRLAVESASAGPVLEGAIGAGTGTICYGWKGGIGVSSRVLDPPLPPYTLGALVQTNFGRAADLTVAGFPVGRYLQPPPWDDSQVQIDRGSVMIVLSTDAPLNARQLGRLCRRAAGGLTRTGSSFGHGSGDFVIAFRAPSPQPEMNNFSDEGKLMDPLFTAVIEAIEEAVLNSLSTATDMTGRDSRFVRRLPMERVIALMRSGGAGAPGYDLEMPGTP